MRHTPCLLWQRNLRLTVALAIALPGILLSPNVARANYDSVFQDGRHCYGISDWYGWMRGTAVEILITNGSAGDGQYSQETWVGSQEDFRYGCTGWGNYCWVEAGYILRAQQSAPGFYFYAYVDPALRPDISLIEVDFTSVYPTDVNGYLGVTIVRDDSYNWYLQFATPQVVPQ